MDAGPFHQLHDAGHKYAFPVADRVYFHFFAPDVFVHQHGPVFINFHCSLQVIPHILFLAHDLHGPAAQNETGAYQDRISDAAGGFHAGFDAGDRFAPGLGDVQGKQQLFKQVPVFRPVNGVAVRTDDLHAPFFQRLGQVDSGLSA